MQPTIIEDTKECNVIEGNYVVGVHACMLLCLYYIEISTFDTLR
jgi:hypothetical protein